MTMVRKTLDPPAHRFNARHGAADHVTLDAQHPWPGAAAYDETASGFFYGRDAESAQLLRLVRLAPLTAVYGKSGLGKTSLLQAGLFPLLRAEHYVPVYLRIDFSETADELHLSEAFQRLLAELDAMHAEYPPPSTGDTLWEYLHRKDLEIWSQDNFPLRPVLVFDQFEELFSRTRGNAKLINEVFDALADLVENRIPAEFATEAAAPRRARLDLLSQRYTIVLSFREDFLPEVRTWEKRVPSLLRNYLRLEPMSRDQAICAVEQAGAAVLADGVAPHIVDFVAAVDPTGDIVARSRVAVEPVLLSLCCYQLNRRRGPSAKIDTGLVDSAGQDILDSFYREALSDPDVSGPPDVMRFIEDHLIQGDRFRGDYPRDEALAENKVTAKQLAALTDTHRLLRVVRHTDTARIELIHDRLVPVVRSARDARRLKQHQEEQEQLAREAQHERDKERARSEELQRQRDEATRSLRRATRFRNLATAAVVACLILMGWGGYEWRQATRATLQNQRTRQSMAVAVSTSQLAEGRLAMKAGTEPLEQTIYRALAGYRLASQGLSEARHASLIALHSALQLSGRLQKTINFDGVTPTPALAFSPDGRTLAIGGDDGLIRLLDAVTYRERGQLDCGVTSESVWTLAFRNDGRRLAAGFARTDGQDGRGIVCVFEVPPTAGVAGSPVTRPLRRWSGKDQWAKPASVVSVAYGSQAGVDTVYSGGTDNALRILNVTTGRMEEIPQPKPVFAVAVSADGSKLVIGGEDPVLRLWDVGRINIDPPKELRGHQNSIEQLAFAPDSDGSILVSSSDDGRIIAWNVNRRCLAQQSDIQPAKLYNVAISPDARHGYFVAAGGADGIVRRFRFSKNDMTCAPASPTSNRAGGTHVLEAPEDGWPSGHSGALLGLAFNEDGSRLVSVGEDGSVKAWKTASGSFELAPLRWDGNSGAGSSASPTLTSIAVSPGGRSVAAGDDEGRIHVWRQPTDGASTSRDADQTWTAHDAPIRALVYVTVANRQILLTGASNGVIGQWDAVSNNRLGVDINAGDSVAAMDSSPDGTKLVAGSKDGAVGVWDAATGRSLLSFPKPANLEGGYELNAVAFTGDGKYIAVGSNYRDVRILDPSRPRDWEHWLEGHSGPVNAVSRVGAVWLVSAGDDGGVLEWDPKALAPAERSGLRKHDAFKFRLGSRDARGLKSMDTSSGLHGGLILTGGQHGQVQLWDSAERLLIGNHFPGQENNDVRAVALAPDGSFFVTADASGMHVWPGPDRWPDELCSKLLRNMSPQQWREWVSPDIAYTTQCPGLPIGRDPAPSKQRP